MCPTAQARLADALREAGRCRLQKDVIASFDGEWTRIADRQV